MNGWLFRFAFKKKLLSTGTAAQSTGNDSVAKLQNHEARASDGFALVDLLVGLAIAGVISSLMIIFLGQARTMMRIERANEMQMEVDAATRFLETAIANAEPLPLSQSTPDNVVYFAGTADQIQFNGVQPIGFDSSALREVLIETSSDPAGPITDLSIVQRSRRGEIKPESENQRM